MQCTEWNINKYDRKNSKEDLNSHYYVAIAAHTDSQMVDVLNDRNGNLNRAYETNHFIDILKITKAFLIDKLVQIM